MHYTAVSTCADDTLHRHSIDLMNPDYDIFRFTLRHTMIVDLLDFDD